MSSRRVDFSEDEKDDSFKRDMSLYSDIDPLITIQGLATAIGVSQGAAEI